MYNILIRPLVRCFGDIETSSLLAKRYFKLISRIPGAHFLNRIIHGNRPEGLQKEVFGMQFYNPLGLGAGLDRNGTIFYELENLGFSFVEIGPLDAKASKKAIDQIRKHPHSDILMACISEDYLLSFSLSYDFCDAFVLDIGNHPAREIVEPILDCRISYEGYKPIIVKILEDMKKSELEDLVDYCMMSGIDGIETRSIEQTYTVSRMTKGRFPIIANCHIKTPQDAHNALKAGAALIEIRSGIITEGPNLVKRILKYLSTFPEYVTTKN